MLSNYLELKLLDHVLKVAAYAQPANLYLGLGTSGSDLGIVGEPNGNAYARVLHNSWNTAANRASYNNGNITFPTATGTWGLISHFGIFDALTGGNLLLWGTLLHTKNVIAGNTPGFLNGDIIPQFNANGASNYLANALLNHVLKKTAYTVPSNIYIALSTANPTDAGTGLVQPVGNNYARVLHNTWNPAANGAISNNGIITFLEALGNWGNITHAALFDNLTAGNMLIHSTVDPAQAPTIGDTIRYLHGAFNISID